MAMGSGTYCAAGSGDLDSRIYVFPNIGSGLATITVTYGANVTSFQYCVPELYGIATSSTGAGSSQCILLDDTAAGIIRRRTRFTGGNFSGHIL